MSVIIVGDIGGTKTTFALYHYSDQSVHCINQQTFSSHDFSQFNDILIHFMANMSITYVDVLGLSIAGPIVNNECHTTNLPWHISVASIQYKISASQVILLNDIEATGYGLIEPVKTNLVQINPNAVQQTGNKAIISIGTGLGEAFLFWDGNRYIPCGTEGGHTDFAPLIEADLVLWHYFKQKFSDHLSYERLISGPGIALIYDFLCQQRHIENPAPNIETSAWISNHAIHQTDVLCYECMDIFIRILANETANLCLKTMAVGGLYISGGIAPKIQPLLEQPIFIEHFISKGRFKQMLKRTPIWINKNECTPLDGVLSQAIKYLSSIQENELVPYT